MNNSIYEFPPKTHVVAQLENKLSESRASECTGSARLLAYYGPRSKPQAQADIKEVCVGVRKWTVEWQCSDNARQEDFVSGIPFWRATGNDMLLQQLIHGRSVRQETWLKANPFGQIDFNNFRSAIFSYVQENTGNPEHSFVLAPIIPHEGDELGKRIKQAAILIRFLLEAGLPRVRVCILRGARTDWLEQSRAAAGLSRQSDILRENVLYQLGKVFGTTKAVSEEKVIFFPRKNEEEKYTDYSHEVENAVKYADLLIPFDGSSGNVLARTFTFLSRNIRLYAVPWFKGDDPWPIGEGAFRDYHWDRVSAPLERAACWDLLRNGSKRDSR